MNEEGFISEIFLSFQGEGLHVGRLQLFVRFAGCSLGCRYCDSVSAQTHPGEFTVQGVTVPNPVTVEDLLDYAVGILDGVKGLHSISVTGGEPLEQPRFLTALLSRCRSLGTPLYLETNGLHPDAAESVFPLVDIISLDIKLPSLCGGEDLFERYERVLPVTSGRDTFCKIVVVDDMDRDEFTRAVDLLADHDPRTPLVIQPVTPAGGCGRATPELLETLYREASGRLEDVRIIPQCHRIIGMH